MADCHEMKKGETYICPGCDLELLVVKECSDEPGKGCCEHADTEPCSIECCGKPLVRKE